jgi:putative ABC transport system ATP-binding protein
MFRLENVQKIYSRHGASVTAFQCPAMTIAEGEYVAILGPSGSGKTTLLSLLGGMLSPTQGRIWLGEQSLYDLSVAERAKLRRDWLGFVFQTFNLVPYLTALENVQVPLCLAGVSLKEQNERATAMLDRFGLNERLRHKPSELSIGQQQRVALARTLVSNPRVILADEPTGNLDPESRELVLNSLSECHREGRTVVMVTHDPVAAERARRTLRLIGGELREDGVVEAKRSAA